MTESDAAHDWDQEADVVVVGFGGAGACAAIEAAHAGAEVLVLDRFMGGGATAISGGVYYGGGGTTIQAEAGVEDDVEQMHAYLSMEVKGAVSDATLRDFCEQSAANLEWLRAAGVPFEASLCPYKTSYPLDEYYLYYSGNESFAPWRDRARPAPRGHRAKGSGLPGANFYSPLEATVHDLGVEVSHQTRAERLVTDSEGRVVGVEARRIESPTWAFWHRVWAKLAIKISHYNPGYAKKLRRRCENIEAAHAMPRRLRARKGVVLSAGGFIHNREMVEEFAAPYRPGMPLGTAGDDGSGIRLGQDAGGATDRMHRVSAWRFINPPVAFTHGMLVNGDGERYVNEQLYGAAVGEAMVEEQGGKAILIIDKTLWTRARSQVGPGKAQWFQTAPTLLNLYANARKGRTVEELARAAKLPVEALRRTVDEYNRVATSDAPDALGKAKDHMHALTDGPFFAIDCSIGSRRFPCPTLTLGGLVVDEATGAVRREGGANIEGLYAAGRSAVGVCSQQYVSGLSIADCVYSGRRAGRFAAQGVTTIEPLASSDAKDAVLV